MTSSGKRVQPRSQAKAKASAASSHPRKKDCRTDPCAAPARLAQRALGDKALLDDDSGGEPPFARMLAQRALGDDALHDDDCGGEPPFARIPKASAGAATKEACLVHEGGRELTAASTSSTASTAASASSTASTAASASSTASGANDGMKTPPRRTVRASSPPPLNIKRLAHRLPVPHSWIRPRKIDG